jgi:hypothetical protein
VVLGVGQRAGPRLWIRQVAGVFIRDLDDEGRLQWHIHNKGMAELKVVLDQLPLAEAARAVWRNGVGKRVAVTGG